MRLRTGIAALTLAVAGTAAMVPNAPAQADVSVHWTEADGISAGMNAATTSTITYKFQTLVNGKPVRWNPCKAIRYRFNPKYQPTWKLADGRTLTGLHIIKEAVAKVSAATGIPFIYEGTTTAAPHSRRLPTSSTSIGPVVLGWSDGASSDLLAGQPASTLAVARTAYFKVVQDGITKAATKGMVIAFDRTNKLPARGTQSWRSVALHELSHGMGLTHVGATSQMMYPMLLNKYRELQTGDKTGLYKLGKSQGCVDLGF